MAAVGGAAGLVLGGVIAGVVGWRWIFLVNVPIGIVTLAVARRVLQESRGVARGLDLPAAGAATAGLALLVLALARAEQAGPLEPLTLSALGGAVLLIVALVVRERTAAHPLVPSALLASRPLVAALLAGGLLTATTSGGAVIASLHLQDVVELEPAAAGLVLLPFSVSAAAGSVLGPRIPGTPAVIVGGGIALVAAGSGVAAAGLTATGGNGAIVAWGVLCGLGIGVASVAATTLGASAVPEAQRGTAAGLLNTSAQVGTAVGIAALVLVAGSTSAAAGHRLGFAVAGAVAALGAVGLAVMLRP